MNIKSFVLTFIILTFSSSIVLACGGGRCSCQKACGSSCGSTCSDNRTGASGTTAQSGITVANKLCPVSGKSIESMGQPVMHEYNGKIYNLCCPTCVKDFKKNPEKYSKIAEDEAAKEKKMQENQDGQK